VKAVYWYTKAAKQNHADAQNKLGDCYYQGRGVSENKIKAAYWHTKAMKQGV
jgi:TPR repeat protein